MADIEVAVPALAVGDDGGTLPEDLRRLAEDAKALAVAELAFQKSRAAYVGGEVRTVALLGLGAAVILFFAVMALVMGLVIAVGSLIGPWGAVVVVTGALLALTVMLALMAKSRWSRMAEAAGEDGEGDAP